MSFGVFDLSRFEKSTEYAFVLWLQILPIQQNLTEADNAANFARLLAALREIEYAVDGATGRRQPGCASDKGHPDRHRDQAEGVAYTTP